MGDKLPADPEIVDAEFTVVSGPEPVVADKPRKPKKRPAGTEHWTEDQYEAWLRQPWWNRWETDWPRVAILGAIALAALLRELSELR